MPNWKKVVTSGSAAELSTLSLTGLSAQNSETDVLTINTSNVIGSRQLSTGAFTSAYVLPTNLAGDDINVDTGALTGATVISDLDFNITTNTSGLVTDANGTVATRTLTLANLGYTGTTDANTYVLPTNLAGDDIDIDTTALTGATVISDLDINITTNTSGLVTDANGSVATRTLTLANLGYTGATDANKYVLPTNLAGDDINVDTGALTGATVISDLDFNITTNTSGLVTDANGTVATRTLTAANLGVGSSDDVTFGSITISTGKIDYGTNTDVDTGTENVATATGAEAAFFDYVVKNGTNIRAGTITAATDGTNVEYNEVSTVDLGSTSDVKLKVVLSSSDLILQATTISNNWNVSSFVRYMAL